MKKVFKVIIDFSEDPENIVSERFLGEQIELAYDQFDDYRYATIDVSIEELPVANVEYLESVKPELREAYNNIVSALEARKNLQ